MREGYSSFGRVIDTVECFSPCCFNELEKSHVRRVHESMQ